MGRARRHYTILQDSSLELSPLDSGAIGPSEAQMAELRVIAERLGREGMGRHAQHVEAWRSARGSRRSTEYLARILHAWYRIQMGNREPWIWWPNVGTVCWRLELRDDEQGLVCASITVHTGEWWVTGWFGLRRSGSV